MRNQLSGFHFTMCPQCQVQWLYHRPQQWQTAELNSILIRVRDCASSTGEWNCEGQSIFIRLPSLLHAAVCKPATAADHLRFRHGGWEEGIWWGERDVGCVRNRRQLISCLVSRSRWNLHTVFCIFYLCWMLMECSGMDLNTLKMLNWADLFIYFSQTACWFKQTKGMMCRPFECCGNLLSFLAGTGSMWARVCFVWSYYL